MDPTMHIPIAPTMHILLAALQSFIPLCVQVTLLDQEHLCTRAGIQWAPTYRNAGDRWPPAFTLPHGLIGLLGLSNSKFRKGEESSCCLVRFQAPAAFAMQRASMQMESMAANLFISLTSSSASNIWSFPCQAGLQVVLGSNRPHDHHVPIYSSSNSLYIQEEAREDDTN